VALNLYLDVQNLYNYKFETQRIFTVIRDENDNPIVNQYNPGYYESEYISDVSGNILPTIGLQFEF